MLKFLTSLGLVLMMALTPMVTLAQSAPITGSFQDNANTEQGFRMERAIVTTPAACLPDQTAATSPACKTAVTTACVAAPTGAFATVGAALPPASAPAPSTVLWSDSTVVEGIAYCYRFLAFNAAGNSGYSNQAGKYNPFSVPPSPSQNTVN